MAKKNTAPQGDEQMRTSDEARNRAAGSLTSFDPASRTVDVILATNTPVRVRSWDVGTYDEILTISPAAIDTSRMGSLALLDSHDRYSGLASRLGGIVPDSLRFENGKAIVKVKISRNEAGEALFRDLEDGHVLPASVSFRPIEQKRTEAAAGGVATVNVTRWMPLELSIVSVPADPAASTRAEQEHPTTEGTRMSRKATNAEIRNIAETAGLDRAWADQHIDDETEIDAVRAAALEAMRARGAATATIRTPHNDNTMDNPGARRRAMSEAVYARTTAGVQISEPARQFVGLTSLDLARECLRSAGENVLGMSPSTIVERALSTSDFPIIMGDAVGRTLREAYSAAPSGLKLVARQTTAPDFRFKHRVQMSEAPKLEKVNENGEFKHGSLAEAKESYKLVTYGKIITMSRQMIVNDDLNAFADTARRMGQASAATEAQLLVDLLVANSGTGPTMEDGSALFHTANHKNYLASGAALSLDTLSAARVAMRKQTGLTGELISIEPKWIVVPPELETKAEQLMTQIAATKAEDANVMAGKFSVVVEPRLTDGARWYVVADTASCDGLEFAYLQGEEGVQVESATHFEKDGVSIKARVDFGGGFVDHRSWYAAKA